MEIKPVGNIVLLEIEEAKAGILDTSSRNSAVEWGKVVAIGEDVKLNIKVGDKVFAKSWAMDNVMYKDKRYIFICPETNGILCTFNE
jgi:co-chaperonin GroES (HSP10)